jgi:hypothetical protein
VFAFRRTPRQDVAVDRAQLEVPAVGAHRVGVRPPAPLVGPFGDLEALVGLPRRLGVLEPCGGGVVVPTARPVGDARSGVVDGQRAGVPGRLGGAVGVDEQDAGLDGNVLQQCGFDRLAGGRRRDPHLVGERERHVLLELWCEVAGGARVEVRLVLDGDDPLDPVRVGPLPPEFDTAVRPLPCLDDAAVARAVDRLADVLPGVARMWERVAVPRPVGGGVADDVQEVRIQSFCAESAPPPEALGVDLDDDGVPAPPLRAELPGDDDGAIRAVSPRRPVALGPLTDP